MALVLAILVFGPLAFGAVGGLAFGLIEGLTVGVLLLWGVRLWLNRRPQLLWPPICWAVLAFALYAIGRYATADVEYIARQELLRVLVYAFLFFAILNNLHRQESMQVISLTLIFLGMAIACYAVFQFLTDSKYVWNMPTLYPHRGAGTYICPNHTAGLFEMLLPLGLAYALTGRLKPVTRIVVGYAALVILAGLVATVSRGGWVSGAVALLILSGVLAFHRTYRLPVLVLVVLVVGAGIYFVPRSMFLRVRFKQLAQAQEQGRLKEDMRVQVWQPAWRMWRDHPWWGVGPGHYDVRFRQYRPEVVQLSPYKAHNDYLNTLADWGLTGAGLLAAVIGLLAWGVAKTWRAVRLGNGTLGGKSFSNKFALVLGVSAALAAILVHSVTDFNLQIPANAILAVTLAALLSSHLRFATERYWTRAGVWARLAASAVLVTGAVYLGQQEWRRTQECLYLRQAAASPNFSPARVAWLKKAYAVEPMNSETTYAIGEAFRIQSAEGADNYRDLATQAMDWFGRTMKLNRWSGYGCLGYGWCLDWLDRSAEAERYFNRADELDPNGYFTMDSIGLHYVQLGDYAAARQMFERSLRLEWVDNPIARNYLQIVNARMMEAATNDPTGRLEPLAR